MRRRRRTFLAEQTAYEAGLLVLLLLLPQVKCASSVHAYLLAAYPASKKIRLFTACFLCTAHGSCSGHLGCSDTFTLCPHFADGNSKH